MKKHLFLLIVFLSFFAWMKDSSAKTTKCSYVNDAETGLQKVVITVDDDGEVNYITNDSKYYVNSLKSPIFASDIENGCSSELKARLCNGVFIFSFDEFYDDYNEANCTTQFTLKQELGLNSVINDTIGGTPSDVKASKACENGGILRVMKLIGAFLSLIKVVVPAALIIWGITGFSNVLFEKDDSQIKTAVYALIKKTIIGLLIAFVPTIIYTVIRTIDDVVDGENEFKNCIVCLSETTECNSLIYQYENK